MDYNEAPEFKKRFGDISDIKDYAESKKDAKGAIPALIVHGPGIGTIKYVKAKPVPKGSAAAKAGDKPKVKTMKERRAELDSKRWCEVIIQLREKFEKAPLDSIVLKDKNAVVTKLVAAFGTNFRFDTHQGISSWNTFDALFTKTAADNVTTILWSTVRQVIASRLRYSGPITQLQPKCPRIQEAIRVAQLINFDYKGTFKKVSAEKGFTEPKSWATLKEDGTPKV